MAKKKSAAKSGQFEKIIQSIEDIVQGRKEAVGEKAEELRERTEEVLQDSAKELKKTAVKVDKNVKKNAWAYLGGALLAGLAAGFVLSKSGKKKEE